YKVTAVKGTRTVQFTKGKKNAKSIVVPSTVKISGKNYKVTTIAKNAFKGNKKLTKVTIGKNVNKIGVSAFQNCSKLKSIVIKSTKLTAKKVGKNAFKGINKKATFKVPKSKVKAYKKIVKAKGAGKNVKVKK
ncbi:MAG: leucine-rich repeat domain-containing protein, partial [Lachnospiraceae bacterium]|nr:leucine-rich repeat domain-containing protein [Lachnospiraceae bacterium]